jgi:hypothetical protein
MMKLRQIRSALLAVAVSPVALVAGAGPAMAATDTPSSDTASSEKINEMLLRRLDMMEKRVRALEKELQRRDQADASAKAKTKHIAVNEQPAAPPPHPSAPPAAPVQPPMPVVAAAAAEPAKDKSIFSLVHEPAEGLKIGMYGEVKFGSQQNPNDNGHWENGFDMARLVLLPTYQFTDNIIFNSEIEFEHSGSGFDADDKLHGTAEVEQAYVDFLISPYFNIRSPGIDLIPVGYTNLHHEPTLFYSVNRPELANALVPTTWASPAAAIYGKLTDGLRYELQVSSALEDFGDDFDKRTEGGTVPPFPTPYAAGIDGIDALGFARPPRGGFSQLSNDVAVTARLDYEPGFLPGFAGSTSLYYTANTTPRGAHADDGAALGHSSLTLLDSEFRYRIPQSGWEFRGEYAQAFFGNPANLRANNDSDPENNVGDTMYGLSGEIAYHVALGDYLGSSWEAVPFYRYTYQDLQTGGFRGTDANTPTGAGKQQFHTVGVAVFPTPELALKLNYQKVLSDQPGGPKSDSVLGGVGFFFP